MHQRRLGNTGLIVSEIGMGTWELGGREWGDIGETDAVDLLRYAFESGVTFTIPLINMAVDAPSNSSVKRLPHSVTGSLSRRNSVMSWTRMVGLATAGNVQRSTSHPIISDKPSKGASDA